MARYNLIRLAKPGEDLLKRRYSIIEEDLALCKQVDDGDFLEWVCKQYSKGLVSLPEQQEELRELLQNFDLLRKKKNFSPSKDINSYNLKSLQELKGLSLEEGNAKKKLLKDTITYSQGPWSLYIPKNIIQFMRLSGGSSTDRFGRIFPETAWCTTNESEAEVYFYPDSCLIIRRDGRNYCQINLVDNEMKNARDGMMVVHGICIDYELNYFLKTLPYKFYFRTPLEPVDYSKFKNLNSEAISAILNFEQQDTEELEQIILQRLTNNKSLGSSLSSVNELITFEGCCLGGEHWDLGMQLLLEIGNPDQLQHYAHFGLRSRWEEAEPKIFQKATAAVDYCISFNFRAPEEVENKIVLDFHEAMQYLKQIIKGRWQLLELAIKNNPYHQREYLDYLKKEVSTGEYKEAVHEVTRE